MSIYDEAMADQTLETSKHFYGTAMFEANLLPARLFFHITLKKNLSVQQNLLFHMACRDQQSGNFILSGKWQPCFKLACVF